MPGIKRLHAKAMSQRSKRRKTTRAGGKSDGGDRALGAPEGASGVREVQSERGPVAERSKRKPSRLKWEAAGICALLVALVFSVFGQTLGHGFVNFDDDVYVYGNPVVTRGLTLGGLRWALTYGEIGHWHPLTWVSHMLDCQLYGLWAGGHHLTNVILHASAVVLLFLVLLKMTGAFWRSAFVAAIWAIHPLRAESVAWIAERKDVLSAFFFMLTLGAYVLYVRKASTSRYLLVVGCFALGLLSKNMLVTLPCVLLLLDCWPLGRLRGWSQLKPLAWEKIPLFALSTISCAITVLVPEKVAAADRLPLWLRLENSVVSFGFYLERTVWPAGLSPFYPNPTHAFPTWEVAGWLALLCLISAAALALRRRHPYLLVGWLWFVGMLMPVIGLAQIGVDARADRRTYLPQIGLLIACAWMAADWAGQRLDRRIALGAIAAVILCTLPIAAYQQVSYWRDSATLWTHALECSKENYLAHNNLGILLYQHGNIDGAMAEFREALQIKPAYAEAHINIGTAYLDHGRLEDAMAEFREALRIDPDHALAHFDLGNALLQQGRTEEATAEFHEALRLNSTLAPAHYNLGLLLFQQGKPDEAMAEFREALEIDPANVAAHNNLGNVLLQQGRIEEAMAQFREALKIDPNHAQAHYNLGISLFRQGKRDEAVAEFREALRIDPNFAKVHFDLGNALFLEGQTEEAIAHARMALELQPADAVVENSLAWMLSTAVPISLRNGAEAVRLATEASRGSGGNNPQILRTLAAAYAAEGQYSEAAGTAEQALQLAQYPSHQGLAEALQNELNLYRANRPFQMLNGTPSTNLNP